MKKKESDSSGTLPVRVQMGTIFFEITSLNMHGLCPSDFASMLCAKAMIRNACEHMSKGVILRVSYTREDQGHPNASPAYSIHSIARPSCSHLKIPFEKNI